MSSLWNVAGQIFPGDCVIFSSKNALTSIDEDGFLLWTIIIIVYYELLFTMSAEHAANDPFWHLPACHLY